MEKTKSLLIIFYRNPEKGKVKTRLAATVGPTRALEIYRKLSLHTREATQNLQVDKIIFYSETIDLMDAWPNATYLKSLQHGRDLGERMHNAFASGFESGYQSICIIGTDCYEITENIIREAFGALKSHDAVIGPTRDGGYYLLGMNAVHPALFVNKAWSTASVFEATVCDFEALALQYAKLPLLTDVDREADLPDEWRLR